MNKAGFYTSEYMYINNVKVGSLFTSFVLQLHVFSIIDILIFSSNKTTGPNSTLLRASLFFNLYFSSGVFPGKLTITKFYHFFLKRVKNRISNYRPILLLSNFDKNIEILIHKRVTEFLNEQKFSRSIMDSVKVFQLFTLQLTKNITN